jgi:hypothetical protein
LNTNYGGGHRETGLIIYQHPMQDNLVARELFFFLKKIVLNQYVDAN